MQNREIQLYIDDILTSIDRIFKYTAKIEYTDFRQNSMLIDATVRNIKIFHGRK